ncbi:MAG: 50S ribosomal protein L22 [Saprospirales bacterium]|nr:50S ribosomal protein L22 [Saprospirales bacterium]MBK8491224.1 50S ribosomal protein L22 [Saprospirales bacterium]
MEAVSKLKNCPLSARKMRLVVDLVRGKRVDDALDILRFTKKEAAVWLEKIILSAVANWENKTDGVESADDFELYVKAVFSDGASVLKRFRPAPHGRANRIRKRSNHVTVVVANRIPLPREANPEAEVEVEEVESE